MRTTKQVGKYRVQGKITYIIIIIIIIINMC